MIPARDLHPKWDFSTNMVDGDSSRRGFEIRDYVGLGELLFASTGCSFSCRVASASGFEYREHPKIRHITKFKEPISKSIIQK